MIIDAAKKGELQNLAVSEDTETIIGYINLGLIELYKRFPVQLKEDMISLEDNTYLYSMPADFMWLVSVTEQVDINGELVTVDVSINNRHDERSIFIVNWNTVKVPLIVDRSDLSFTYVVTPPTYTIADLTNEVAIPIQMVEALLHYVGYRGHTAQSGEVQAENSTHYTRFNASCARLEASGAFSDDDMDMQYRILSWI